MKVEYVKHPENDIMPPTPSEEKWKQNTYVPTLYELSGPFDPAHPNSKFWLRCHKCGLVANLGSHDLVEITDGLVTIHPSILCPRQSCGAHYFIKKGEIV